MNIFRCCSRKELHHDVSDQWDRNDLHTGVYVVAADSILEDVVPKISLLRRISDTLYSIIAKIKKVISCIFSGCSRQPATPLEQLERDIRENRRNQEKIRQQFAKLVQQMDQELSGLQQQLVVLERSQERIFESYVEQKMSEFLELSDIRCNKKHLKEWKCLYEKLVETVGEDFAGLSAIRKDYRKWVAKEVRSRLEEGVERQIKNCESLMRHVSTKLIEDKEALLYSLKDEIIKGLPQIGIKNGGNTCYFNASMQALFSLRSIRELIYEQAEKDEKRGRKDSVAICARRLLCEYYLGRTEKHAPLYLLKTLGWSNTIGRQQDAEEFVTVFLDQLNYPKHVYDYKMVQDSEACYVTQEYFRKESDSTSILQFHNVEGVSSLVELLKSEAEKVQNDPDNAWLWNKEKVFNRYQVISQFKGEPPEELIVEFKRFSSEVYRDGHVKTTKNTKKLKLDHDEWIDLSAFCQKGGATYRVKAVVVHHGRTLTGGHYTADVRIEESWYHFNDSREREISSSKVDTANGYLYFLERVE